MIQVFLTPEENQGHRIAGNATDGDVEGVIFLILCLTMKDETQAGELAPQLASAALSARRKIHQATAFEIVVATDPQEENDDE